MSADNVNGISPKNARWHVIDQHSEFKCSTGNQDIKFIVSQENQSQHWLRHWKRRYLEGPEW
jgi:hypothetical protein